jgi:hypothetical protein
MTAEFPATDRCPKCGATVRFGDPWCTLCYTDLRPPAPPEPEPEPVADVPVDAPVAEPVADVPVVGSPAYSPPASTVGQDPLTAPLEAVASPAAGPSWPCSTCGTVNPMARDTCSVCGKHFLAGLKEDEAPLLELPVVGDITRLGRGQRFAIAFGVVVAVLILTLLLGLIFG